MPDFQATYFTIFLISLISSILIVKLYKSSGVKPHLPPAPFRLPIIGHLHLLGRRPHQDLHRLSNRHGPVFRLFLGSTPNVVVTTPETAKDVFKTHENTFLDRPRYLVGNYLSYGEKGLIFAPYGSYWRFLKKIMMSQFLNDNKSVELERELMKMENNVISRMFMSKRCLEEDDITKTIAESATIVGEFNISDHIWFCKNLDLQGYGKSSKDIHRRYDTFMERIIAEHQVTRKQERGGAKDMLSILLDISEDESIETKLTREDIKALIKTKSIKWLEKNRLIQESDMPNLPYLQAIIKETLRLHPVTPVIQRLLTQDCTVGGYHIPANTATLINVWSLNRDPVHWESPLEFKPERFEGNQLDVRGQHFHLLPFGGGRRLCPGTSLSLLLVPTILGAMIQCFEWKTRNNGTVDMEDGFGLTIPRANPLVCVPVARLDPIPLFVLLSGKTDVSGTIVKRQLHNNFSGLFYGLPFTKPNPEFVQSVKSQFSPDSKILIVCQEGLRSSGAANKLEAAGFQNIACITSGLQSVKPGWFDVEGSKELQDAGKGGLVQVQGKISAVLGTVLICAYLFITFFPDQAEKILALVPSS
ncbi:hypothetical protein L1987_50966 [Smallanthus sonchifolius]|uniref:Uncharacterized protein n=1 Tax=Smallanthus sonchifolius TaxID=185202 RepID=A0ACB9EPB6_9ASTR|nr:hypothetical protein L1987_50966 [Smallanthus sonchifolius]